jgi:RNA polymerase sigma-70 factor (ECF subfamily)
MPIDWSEVLTRHDRWLRTVVWARVREFRAVDDVMQEVALAAVAQRAPLADPTKLAPWLYRLAVTQALLYRRSQGRQRKLADRYAQQLRSGAPDALAGDPLAWMLAVERRQLVRAALERLPRRDAEILLLKYIEEWSYQELAAHLGISQSAIEARLHRARQRLRTALADRHEIEVSP